MKKPVNHDLYTALKDWYASTVNAIKLAHEKQPAESDSGSSNLQELPFKLSAYQRCVEELKRDRIIVMHFDRSIESGVNSSLVALTPEIILKRIIGPVHVDKRPVYDESNFNLFYEKFEKDFYDDFIEFEAVSPVQGLVVVTREQNPVMPDSPNFLDDLSPIILSADLSISPLISDEIKLAHNIEVVRRYGPRLSDEIYAIRAKYQQPKYIADENNSTAIEQEQFITETKMREVDESVEEVVWILRLFKSGNINQGGTFHKSENIFSGAAVMFSSHNLNALSVNFQPYIIEPEDRDKIPELWEKIQLAKLHPPNRHLLTALRRLNFSRMRENVEDKIIDLMIAGEAFAQSGKGAKGEPIAEFIARLFPAQQQARIKKLFADIYQIRNQVVHEGTPERWLKANPKINLYGYVLHAEELLRIALRQAFEKIQ